MRELTDIEKEVGGYAFECWWDGSLDIEREVAKAREFCGLKDAGIAVTASSRLAHPNALVSVSDLSDEVSNMRHLVCVRSYLLDHGWTRRRPVAHTDWEI